MLRISFELPLLFCMRVVKSYSHCIILLLTYAWYGRILMYVQVIVFASATNRLTVLTLVANRTSIVKWSLYWLTVTLFACDIYLDWGDVTVVDRYWLEKEVARSVSGKDTNFIFAITCRPLLEHRAAHRPSEYSVLFGLLCSALLLHISNFVLMLCGPCIILQYIRNPTRYTLLYD